MTQLTKEQIERDFIDYKEEKKRIVDNNIPIKGKYFRKATRPIQRSLLFGQRVINGQKVTVMGNKNFKIPKGRQVIFVVSHIGKWDFEIVNEQLKQQFYVLASDYRNMHGNFAEFMMNWFGVYFVDEVSREDKMYTGMISKKTLREKCHMMFFPEGTWNLDPNEIIMDTHFGAVDAAMTENALILPIAIEQYDKDFVINIGNFYDPNKIARTMSYKEYKDLNENDPKESQLKLEIKTVTNTIMRDLLASFKMYIWETKPIEARKDIPDDYWEKFIEERKKEWPGYSMQEQIDSVVHTPEKRLHEQVLKDLKEFIKLDPWYFLTTNERFANYLNTLENMDEIEKILEEFRKNQEPIKPIEERLEQYKALKKTRKSSE